MRMHRLRFLRAGATKTLPNNDCAQHDDVGRLNLVLAQNPANDDEPNVMLVRTHVHDACAKGARLNE